MYYAMSLVAGIAIAIAGCWIFLVYAMDEVETALNEAEKILSSSTLYVPEAPTSVRQALWPA
jgi:hypothetical protein